VLFTHFYLGIVIPLLILSSGYLENIARAELYTDPAAFTAIWDDVDLPLRNLELIQV
jgi:hypothetical protein